MNDDRSLERAARSWLETGPTQAPDHAVEAALARIQTTTQERDLRVPWRNTSMRIQVAVAAAVALVAIGGVAALIRLPAPPGPDATLPAASAPPSSAVPSPSPSTASQRARWHHVEQLHSPRRGTEGVVLTDGRILITGGIYRQTSNTAELFDPRTETWSLASPMREAREYPVATLLADGRVLVFSGWSGDPPTAEIYDPQDDS